MGHAALATFARLLLHANFFLYSPTLSACLSLTLYFFLSLAVPVAAWKYAVKNVIAFNVTIEQGKRRSRNAARRRKRSDWGRGSGRGSGDQLHSQLQLASLALHVPLATRQRARAKQQQKQQRRRRLSTCPQVGLNCQTERHSDSVQYIMKTVSHTHTPTLTSSDTHIHTERALWFSGLQAVPLIKTGDQRQLAKATSTIFFCVSAFHSLLCLPFLLTHSLPLAPSSATLTCYMACRAPRGFDNGEKWTENVALDTLYHLKGKRRIWKISQKYAHTL